MTLEQGHPLARLRSNGLTKVESTFPRENLTALAMDIYFIAPRNESTAESLVQQIEESACRNCIFRTQTRNFRCSGAKAGDFNQVLAEFKSASDLTRGTWREIFAILPCEPSIGK